MKYFLFIILLVGIMITSGCVGGNQTSVVTPTQTGTAISSEPIVGIWQWTTADGSHLYTFNFFADGRYSFTDSSDPNTQPGTWSKVRENEYLISYTGGKTQAVLFNPATETFTMPEFSQVKVYRMGKEPVRTPPTQILTLVTTPITPTPIHTINKNSIAYLNYQADLREITDLQTEFKIITSNYLTEMQNAGRDVAWGRDLTIEYNKLKAEYEIRLNAAQARADADLAEAERG